MDKLLIERLTENRFPVIPFTFNDYNDAMLAHFTVEMLKADRTIYNLKYRDDSVIMSQEKPYDDYPEDLLGEKITDALLQALAQWGDTDISYYSVMQYTNRSGLNHLIITIHFRLAS